MPSWTKEHKFGAVGETSSLQVKNSQVASFFTCFYNLVVV